MSGYIDLLNLQNNRIKVSPFSRQNINSLKQNIYKLKLIFANEYFSFNQMHLVVGAVNITVLCHCFPPVQFGNTCYCNSVLQALFFCKPFREKVLQYKQQQKNQKKETLLTCLADLFHSIATQKKKVGTVAPKKFIQRLRKENGNLIIFCFLAVCLYF